MLEVCLRVHALELSSVSAQTQQLTTIKFHCRGWVSLRRIVRAADINGSDVPLRISILQGQRFPERSGAELPWRPQRRMPSTRNPLHCSCSASWCCPGVGESGVCRVCNTIRKKDSLICTQGQLDPKPNLHLHTSEDQKAFFASLECSRRNRTSPTSAVLR